MEKYVKIKISFKDKLNLLFFDLFPEKIFHSLHKMESKEVKWSNSEEIYGPKVIPVKEEQEEQIKFFDHIEEKIIKNF